MIYEKFLLNFFYFYFQKKKKFIKKKSVYDLIKSLGF
jgi:hypothetical protein